VKQECRGREGRREERLPPSAGDAGGVQRATACGRRQEHDHGRQPRHGSRSREDTCHTPQYTHSSTRSAPARLKPLGAWRKRLRRVIRARPGPARPGPGQAHLAVDDTSGHALQQGTILNLNLALLGHGSDLMCGETSTAAAALGTAGSKEKAMRQCSALSGSATQRVGRGPPTGATDAEQEEGRGRLERWVGQRGAW
jgi:hypothetical protein